MERWPSTNRWLRFGPRSENLNILGNFIGTNPAGASPSGNGADGIYSAGGTSSWEIVGNNLIAGNTGRGLHLNNNNTVTPTTAEIAVSGNYFGVDRTGLIGISNSQSNIAVRGANVTDFVIGGTGAGDRNIFGASGEYGVDLRWQSNVSVLGNFIGIGADGTTPVGNTLGGVYLADGDNITIGNGSAAGSNVIAHNDGPGISAELQYGTSTVAYLRNAIYANNGLGIDLGIDGVTANDPGDGDSGTNNLLNFPVINSIFSDGSADFDYDVSLDVPANPNGYRIEFYKNTLTDSSAHGEGETYLGHLDVPGAGNYIDTFTASEMIDIGDIISATATRKSDVSSFDLTSEFSMSYTASAALPNLQVAMSVDVYDPLSAGVYALPLNEVVTTLSVVNEGIGDVDAGSINLVIPISSDLAFYNGDFDDTGPETGAVIFTDTSSGLTFDSAVNLAFYNGATKPADFAACTYSPVAGYDPAITYVCVNPSGAMLAGDPDPAFEIQFRSRMK